MSDLNGVEDSRSMRYDLRKVHQLVEKSVWVERLEFYHFSKNVDVNIKC